jgi:peptide/nickel transport system substrate-binding protein
MRYECLLNCCLVGLAASLITILGCGRSEPPGPSLAAMSASSAPTAGGELMIATLADAGRLDPHAVTDAASMRVIEHLYSTLLRHAPAYGEYEPDLAESIEVSDDGRTYTLTLVADASFHSGRSVTAEDVKYSIERIVEMGVRGSQFSAVSSIDTPDERTVVLRLAHAFAPLRSALANPMNAIVDREVVEANGGSLDASDAGSGPFKLHDWQRDRHVILDRNDGYHVPGRPYLDRLTFRPMPDETARSTALRTGEVQLVLEVSPKDVRRFEGLDDVVLDDVPGTFWEYIGLNCAAEPFDDPRVRRAIALAIDRGQLNQLVKFGHATPLTGGHIPPNHWAHAGLDSYATPNPDAAAELLAEAGHRDGLAFELIVDSSVGYQVRAAEVIKQQLRPLGVEVAIQGLESTAFFDRLGSGDFQATVVGWMGFVDPDEWTWNLFHSEGAYNQQQYHNATVDRLLDEARRATSRAARAELYAEALAILAVEAPMVFLYVNDQAAAHRAAVRGWSTHATATALSLRDTWLAR